MRWISILVAGLALIAGACSPSIPTPLNDSTRMTVTEPSPVREAIWIQSPGPGARVTSPLVVRGEAEGVFEQTLVAQLVDPSGELLTLQPVHIEAPLGARAPFEAVVHFEVSEDVNALLQVYAVSASDGGILHLASAGLTLTTGIPVEGAPVEDGEERLVISSPVSGQELPSGVLQVAGYGIASFEGTLLLSLQDAEGRVLAEEVLTIAAEEMGMVGAFQAALTFQVDERQPGRLVLTDPLPVFNGLGHVTSIPITLLP